MHPDQLPPALQTVIARVVKAERRRANRQAENARKEVYAALGEVLVKSLPGVFVKAAEHAPAGGVKVQGKEYTGGQFIPADVMANATAEEKAAVAGGGKATESDPDRKAITDRLAGFNNVGDLELEHDELREDLFQRLQASDDDEESDRLADLIQFSDEELERLKEEIESQDDDEPEDEEEEEPEDTGREELSAGDWHPVHADDWMSEDTWRHEDPAEAAWDSRKSQAANRARFEKQLAAQTAADAAQVADFAAEAEARVKALTGDDTDAATVREFGKDAASAIEDATSEYTAAAADYYDADKEAYKAESKVPDGAMSTADIDSLEDAADRYREMRLAAAEKLPPADRDSEVERIERQHEARLSGVDRRAAKLRDKADQLAAVRDEQAARYEAAKTAYATTLREQVAAIQSALADIADGFGGRAVKAVARIAKSLGLSLQLADLKEGVRRGVAADVWAYRDLLAACEDEWNTERFTKADRSHLVRKVIRNKLGRRQVVWVKPQDAKAEQGGAVGEDSQPVKDEPKPLTREQVAESRTIIAQAVADPNKLNPEQLKDLARHVDAITKEEARGLLKTLGAKLSGDQKAVAERLVAAVRAGREQGKGVGDALRAAGNKTTGQYGAWGAAAGGGAKPVSRDEFPKRGLSPEEAMVERARLAKVKEQEEQGVGSRKFDAKKKRKTARKSDGKSLAEVVKSYGGIDPDSHAFKAHFGSMKEAMEYGLTLGMFKKGGRGFDQMAQELESSGHIQVAEGEDATQYLADQLMKKASSDLYDRKEELQRAEEEYYAAMQEAANELGIDYEYNPNATAEDIFGDVPGFAEAHQGAENDAAQEAASDPYGSRGQGNEQAEEGVDDPFADFDNSIDDPAPANSAEFDRRMESIDPRDSGRVEVPEPVRPLEPDDADKERYDAAVERRDRMRDWAADRPNDLRAEEQVRRAEARVREAELPDVPVRREPAARPVGPRPVSELTDAEIEAERRELPRNRRTPAQAERERELVRENARRNPLPAGGGTPFPLLGGGPGVGNNDRSDERTAQQPTTDHRARAATHRQTAAELEATARDAAAEGDREAARLNAVAARASREAANTHDEVAAVKRLQERERAALAADQERRRQEAEAKIGDTAGRLDEARAKEEAAKKRVEELRAGRTEPAPKPAGRRQNFQTLRRQAAEGMAVGAAAMQQPHDGSALPDQPMYASLSPEQRADLDAQHRAAKTRQDARGVELLAQRLSAEAESNRRADATNNPPQSPATAVDNPASVGNTTPVQPRPAGANQGGGAMTTMTPSEAIERHPSAAADIRHAVETGKNVTDHLNYIIRMSPDAEAGPYQQAVADMGGKPAKTRKQVFDLVAAAKAQGVMLNPDMSRRTAYYKVSDPKTGNVVMVEVDTPDDIASAVARASNEMKSKQKATRDRIRGERSANSE